MRQADRMAHRISGWRVCLTHVLGLLLAASLAACAFLGLPLLPNEGEVPTADLPPKASSTAPASPTILVMTPEPPATPTSSATVAPTATPVSAAERVLILSLDGLRPDALSQARTPVILGLAASGASTLTAETVFPTLTLPAHASMLSGLRVENHGITWNNDRPEGTFIQTPTVFSVAQGAGLRTEMVVSSEKLVQLAAPGAVDEFTYISGGDLSLAAQAREAIIDGFDVLFVHLLGPDTAGHSDGWMSPVYLATVADTDQAVGRILAALDEAGLRRGTLIFVTSDHGGHNRRHGSSSSEDMTIPWIVTGPGVVSGTRLETPIITYDTTATALWALALPLPEDLDGRPVVEAFG